MEYKIFTKEQIEEIWNKQKELDIEIRNKNNIDMEKDLHLEKYLALKTELFELINQIESFKYWKKHKGKDNILEEGIDVIHFIFSICIDNDYKPYQNESFFKNFNELKEEEEIDINELFVNMDCILIDMIDNNDISLLSLFLSLLLYVLQDYGFSVDDIYNAYFKKNEINHERQNNNY